MSTFRLFKDEEFGTVKAWFFSAMVWFALGTTAGAIDATHMAAPELLGNTGWMVFGRIRPIHTNTVIFGFVGAMLLGASYYMVPALLRTPLYSERIGRLSLWVWNLSVLFGNIGLAMGYNQGREYAEWIWPVDIGILTSFGLIFYNLVMTARGRQEKVLYVTTWYVFGSLVFTWLIYFTGNAIWNPRHGAIMGAIPDGILAWFYGHGLVGLFLTPLAVGVAYYVLPIVSRSPVYSHTVSLVGFWSILFIYSHIGTHHLLQAPTPTWNKILAITGSIAMFIPVMTALVNLYLTTRGRLGSIHADIGGKFVMAGLVWYALVCIQGPLQSLPIVQRVTHFNNWVIGHSHIAVLGFSGFIALGGMYFIIPRITGKPLFSIRLADIQYWLVLIGITGFFFILTPAGLIQGNGWMNGETEYRLLPEVHVYMILRLYAGYFIVAGAYLGLYIVYKSFHGVPVYEEEPAGPRYVEAMSPGYVEEKP